MDLTQYRGETWVEKWTQWSNDTFRYPAADLHGNAADKERMLGQLANPQEISQLMAYLMAETDCETRSPGNLNDSARTINLHVDCNRFYRGDDEEPGRGGKKKDYEAAWLSRPHVPVTASVKVANKKGTPLFVPEAVGPLALKWSFRDDADNMGSLPSNVPGRPSRTKEYVTRAKQMVKASAMTAPHWYPFNNAPSDVGGCVHSDKDQTVMDFFCKALHPHNFAQNETVGEDPEPIAVKDKCQVGSRFRGRSILYIRPSTIAGDNYRVTAAIHFDDTNQHDALNKRLSDKLPNREITKQSATLVVWRRIRVAAIITWPDPANVAPHIENVWQAVQEEMTHCYVTLSNIDEIAKITYTDLPWLEDAYREAMYATISDEHNADFFPNYISGQPLSHEVAHEINNNFGPNYVDPINRQLGYRYTNSAQFNIATLQDLIAPARAAVQPWIHGSKLDGHPPQAAADTHDLQDAAQYYLDRFDELTLNVADLQNVLGKDGATIKATLKVRYISNGAIKPYKDYRNFMRNVEWDDKLLPFTFEAGRHSEQDFIANLNQSVQLVTNNVAHILDLHYRRQMLEVQGTKFKHLSDGLIIVHFLPHPRVELSDQIPGTGGRHRMLEDIGGSFGKPMGVAFISQATHMDLTALVAHEVSHCTFLRHFLNADGPMPLEHDQDDQNCIMSYPFLLLYEYSKQKPVTAADKAHQMALLPQPQAIRSVTKYYMLPQHYRPHFCGKCNLNHRGWDIQANVLPAGSAVAEGAIAPAHAAAAGMHAPVAAAAQAQPGPPPDAAAGLHEYI